jgi:hypothetical protein
MTTAGIGISTCWIWCVTVASVISYTLCWLLSGSVLQVFIMNVSMAWVVAMGPGNLPLVRFGSNPIQIPDPLQHGGPNLDPYRSTSGFCQTWLDPSVPISGSSFLVFLFMVTFRYPIANRKILTLVYHCSFLMYCRPVYSKTSENRSLPHPENESQLGVNDFWSCTLGNLSGH